MRPLLPSVAVLIALVGCSSDVLGPPVEPPNFAVSGMSDDQCFALAKRLDAINQRIAEATAEVIIVGSNRTDYLGAAWTQSGGYLTRFVFPDGTVDWPQGAVTHRKITYTLDGRALVASYGVMPLLAQLVIVCNTL